MLALTHASGPSVIQIRGQNVLPNHMASIVVAALTQHETARDLRRRTQKIDPLVVLSIQTYFLRL